MDSLDSKKYKIPDLDKTFQGVFYFGSFRSHSMTLPNVPLLLSFIQTRALYFPALATSPK